MKANVLPMLAWRNLWRSRRRTAITAASVAGAVWMAVTFLGIAEYAYNDMVNRSATMGFGHVSVAARGYNDAPSIGLRLPSAERLVRSARATEGVDAALARVVGQGMFATARKTTGGLLLGIDPAEETAERNLFLEKLKVGEPLKPGDEAGVLVGKRMAKTLDLQLGSKLIWTSTDVNGEVVSEVGRVRGLFETGVAEVDSSTVLMPISRARKVLGMREGAATIVAVFLSEHRAATAMQTTLAAKAGSDAEVLSWMQTQPEMSSYVKVDRSSNELFQLLIGLVVAAGILNTMLMGVLERKRELGVLLAIGMPPRSLFALVMWEALWVGLLGLALGTLLVLPWAYYLYTAGIDMSALVSEDITVAGVMFDMRIHIRLATAHFIAIPLAVLVLTLAASVYPAAKAALLAPIDSLRTLD